MHIDKSSKQLFTNYVAQIAGKEVAFFSPFFSFKKWLTKMSRFKIEINFNVPKY